MDQRLQLGLGGIGVGVAVSTKSSPKLTFQLTSVLSSRYFWRSWSTSLDKLVLVAL